MAFRFIGAPMIGEPTEFGHKAFPIYTTFRDFGISIVVSVAVAGMCVLINAWLAIIGMLFSLLLALIVTQRLRKAYGYGWTFEILARFWYRSDERGVLKMTGKRHFSQASIDATPQFLNGTNPALVSKRHKMEVQSVFLKRSPPLQVDHGRLLRSDHFPEIKP
jgi:uncharacterized membrane protein